LEGLGDRPAGTRRLRSRLLHPAAGGLPLNVETTIPESFARQVSLRADETAIAGGTWRPTYAELDAVSDRIALEIARRGGGPSDRVVVLLRHDASLIAAMLGALKSGGTAVVLDPRWPPERLRRTRERLAAQVALVDRVHRELALAAGFSPSSLVEVAERPEAGESAPLSVRSAPPDLAFLIQTSGSTGSPKSVMQTHRNVLHNALVRLAGGLDIGAEDRIALLASPSGGQGLSTVWTALLSGATLCPFPVMERGVTGLPEWLEEHGVTVLVSSASLFRHFARTLDGRRLPGVRLVRLGSEQAFASDFEAFRAHFSERCRLVNSFSSSETGNLTQHILGPGDEPAPGPLPVGSPAAGIELLLLDDGEVAIRSDYLSPGYWGDQTLTSERFGEGIFRTGDLGRFSDGGMLTLLGRKDAQVKVRGSRVDLVEVEGALAARPGVAATAVTPRPSPRGETALTAYVALQPGAAAEESELRSALGTTLPPHAIPTTFAFVDSLPLNAHGKVDREALAQIEPAAARRSDGASAVTETEELLADIWAAALERDSVTPDEDFFALEGDSLTAAEIAAAVRERFGVEIELDTFAESPTVAEMAELIERRQLGDQDTSRSALPKVSREGPIPCSLIQERTWHQSQTMDRPTTYNVAAAVRIRGPLDLDVLRRTIDRLVARHESLRTTFVERDGAPMQIVHPPAPLEIPVLQLKNSTEADELLRREAGLPFDLERGPLVRFRVARLGENDYRLLRLNHHINADGHSWQIFFKEFAALYEAEVLGKPPPLADRAVGQYPDFAAWEHGARRPGTPRWREDVDWWRGYLEGAPTRRSLPFARREPDVGAPISDGIILTGLPSNLRRALTALQRREGATHFMTRLSAFAVLLAAMSGEQDVVLGTYGTTRQLVEMRDTFGFFANPLILRLRFEGRPSFREWLAQVRAAVIQVSAHAQTPHDALCNELRESGTIPPEFQAILGVANDALPLRFAGLEMTHLGRVYGTMPWGFSVQFRRSREAERFRAIFDARLHHPRAVRVFMKRYRRLLGIVCSEPDRPLPDLLPAHWARFGPLLRRRVVERR
jgi:non-ribosomal peptide synthetase component F/acyl carrier protein